MALRRKDHVDTGHTERIEHYRGTDTTPGPTTNVNVGATAAWNDAVTAVTRVVMIVFTALEVLLLLRFTFKLTGANAAQPLVAWLYAFTDPLVRPFQGIFPEPRTGVVIDIASLLAILFLFLIGWLIVALVRAVAGRPVA
ncbi:MAG: YggT family protein [Chloroflexota bacterium]|nr:YggT family protein [Chloroflexota bacterium]MDE3193370.1 YggT family protein [Chloroflexota bacterium]